MIHALKILPEFFKAMAAGTKVLRSERMIAHIIPAIM